MAKPKNEKSKYSEFLNWCLDECWRIQEQLHLTEYRIMMEKEPEKIEDDYAFEITVEYPYKKALLKWREPTYEDWLKDKNKVSAYLIHEMIHILLEPLAQLARQRYTTPLAITEADEAITDHLTNILRHHISLTKQ